MSDAETTPAGPAREQLDIWVPMRRYELELRHVLLSRLGGISRFVLYALQQGVTLDLLRSITGLRSTEFEPILMRLQGLQLIADDALTPAGLRLAKISQSLHEKRRVIWLDQRYRAAPIMLAGDALIRQKPPGHDVVWAVSPPRVESQRDVQQQQHRLLGRLAEYLPGVFPECHDAAAAGNTLRPSEWEIELHPVDGYDHFGLVVQVDRAETSAAGGVAQVATPVSCLITTYTLPASLRGVLSEHAPPAALQIFSHADRQLVTGLSLHASPPDVDGKRLPRWPDISPHDRRLAVDAMRPLAEEADRAVAPLLNRVQVLETRWEVLHFSESVIRDKCRLVAGVVMGGGRHAGH